MSVKKQVDTKIIELAEAIGDWSKKLLDKAPLTDDQREDIDAINQASLDFINYASSQIKTMPLDVDSETKQKVRHQLRNHLNIIIGFSRLIVKDLPDNLLMDMVTVRKIHDTGEMLMVQVDSIQ